MIIVCEIAASMKYSFTKDSISLFSYLTGRVVYSTSNNDRSHRILLSGQTGQHDKRNSISSSGHITTLPTSPAFRDRLAVHRTIETPALLRTPTGSWPTLSENRNLPRKATASLPGDKSVQNWNAM
jgi:hypothetical protein